MNANEAIEKLREALTMMKHSRDFDRMVPSSRAIINEVLAATATIDPPGEAVGVERAHSKFGSPELQSMIVAHAAQPAADHALICPTCKVDRLKDSCPSLQSCGMTGTASHVADHAKRAEGERAAFEAWALSDEGNCSRADLMRWSPKDRQAQEGETYCCDLVERDWQVWQARGQQAGVPEGCVIAPIEPTEAMIHAAEDIPAPRPFGKVYRAMLAAIPGEAQHK